MLNKSVWKDESVVDGRMNRPLLLGIGHICFKYFMLTSDVPILVDDHLRDTQMSFCNLLNPKKIFFCVF